MYNPFYKKKALELYTESDDMRPIDVYRILKEEYDFTGTPAIVRYWLRTSLNEETLIDTSDTSLKTSDSTIKEYEDDEDEDEDDVLSFSEIEAISDPTDVTHTELFKAVIKLRKSRQNLMDQNRILRKMFRERDRVENTTEQLLSKIYEALPRYPARSVKLPEVPNNERVLIVQLTDLHLNEAVLPEDTKGFNEYNFEIAARRLRKYACRIREFTKAFNIQNVVVAITGDIFNSNRRKDEIIRNIHALSEGFLVGAHIIAQFLQDLSEHHNLEVFTVFGNESRIDEDIQNINFHHNFDYLLPHFLARMLENQSNIYFHEPNPGHEEVVNINGANILMWHGHNKSNIDKQILKYAKKGIIIHYVIRGHFHNLMIRDTVSQSASLVGDNAYNFYRLHAVGRAAQNIIMIERNNEWPEITPIPIDLQNVDNVKEGYFVPEHADLFGMRAASRKGEYTTILRIVV